MTDRGAGHAVDFGSAGWDVQPAGDGARAHEVVSGILRKAKNTKWRNCYCFFIY
jgi:hypothetical protein